MYSTSTNARIRVKSLNFVSESSDPWRGAAWGQYYLVEWKLNYYSRYYLMKNIYISIKNSFLTNLYLTLLFKTHFDVPLLKHLLIVSFILIYSPWQTTRTKKEASIPPMKRGG